MGYLDRQHFNCLVARNCFDCCLSIHEELEMGVCCVCNEEAVILAMNTLMNTTTAAVDFIEDWPVIESVIPQVHLLIAVRKRASGILPSSFNRRRHLMSSPSHPPRSPHSCVFRVVLT